MWANYGAASIAASVLAAALGLALGSTGVLAIGLVAYMMALAAGTIAAKIA
jgi:hypothetical protein